MLKIDAGGLLAELVIALKPDILWLLENKFLDPRFWKNPDQPGNIRAKYRRAVHLYYEEDWGAIIEFTLDRIAVLRDGRLVQVGTPRQLLREPADDQVAELLSSPRRQIEVFEALLDGGEA